MATLIPDLATAAMAKQKPTEGELFLLEFLASQFNDNQTEIYFQPCFNGDRPDIVLLHPENGVIIVEAKDWNLDLYEIDKKNNWRVHPSHEKSQEIKSPFAQVFHYKKNFFDIHVNGLLERKLQNNGFFQIITTYVYFHHGSRQKINRLYAPHLDRLHSEMFENNRKFRAGEINQERYDKKHDSIDRWKRKFSRDQGISIHPENLQKIKFREIPRNVQFYGSVYDEFRRLLNPPYHYAHEGRKTNYSKLQARLIQSQSNARIKICGIAGSGKTVVLAGRSVNAHKRHGEEVLVLTFNITMRSYIKDKISAVREDFDWKYFQLTNYHSFIAQELNALGIPVKIPEDISYGGRGRRNAYLEEKYYSNQELFERKKGEIKKKYLTILIDEVQDFKPAWIEIIRSCFLENEGEMILFGDEKQNIYHNGLDEERRPKVPRGFGRWEILRKSFRYTEKSPIIPLAESFKNSFLQNYAPDADESFLGHAQPELAGIGLQGWAVLGSAENMGNIIIKMARHYNIHPNDILILASKEGILREIDNFFTVKGPHRERTLTTFPSLKQTQSPKYSDDYDQISRSKKVGFNLNSGVMKLGTIHSLKGFESPFVFLLVHKEDSPELIFTGITRAKEGLVVFLEHDSRYLDFFRSHLEAIGVDSIS